MYTYHIENIKQGIPITQSITVIELIIVIY